MPQSKALPTTPKPEGEARTKVLIIIGSLEVGGAEMDIVRNAPCIDRSRFDVQVALFSHRGALADRLEDSGIHIHCRQPRSAANEAMPAAAPAEADPIDFNTLPPPSTMVGRINRLLMRWAPAPIYKAIVGVYQRAGALYLIAGRVIWLRRLLLQTRADIVHAILPSSYIYAMLAHMLAPGRRRFAMSRLSLNFYFKSHPCIHRVETVLCHRLIDRAVGNSQAVLADLRAEGIPERRLFLLYNGIETERFSRPASARDVADPDGVVTMSAVANLHTYKGYDDLLAALVLLKARCDRPWMLRVAGRDEGGNLARFQDFCAANDLSERVEFLGLCADVRPLLWNSQMHIHASHTEGLPNSIIEAMSAGLPVVGTRVGGIPELILDGETGFLVSPRAPEELCDRLLRLLDDASLRGRMGAAARDRAAGLLDVNRSVARYEELYTQLADR